MGMEPEVRADERGSPPDSEPAICREVDESRSGHDWNKPLVCALSCFAVLFSCTGAMAVQPEEVAFRSGESTLRGFIFRPAGDGPFPAVLYNHGSERLPGTKAEIGDLFAGKGYVVFVPHRRGQGRSQSEGTYIMEQAGKPHKLVILPAYGSTHQEGHGKFCNSGGAVWGPEVLSFLAATMKE